MKRCWKILGIKPTANTDAVKKAYRELVKKYHPDKARSPEKIRHYTIKCAEIIEAYGEALKLSATVLTEPSHRHVAANVRLSGRSNLRSASTWLGFAFCLLFIFIGVGIWGELLFDFKAGPLTLTTALLRWFSELPLESNVRQIISGVIAIPLGVLFGGVLAMFGPMYPPIFVVTYLENTRLSNYSYKIAWILFTVAQYFVIYHFGFHWPFEHRASSYYAALYEISRFAGWMYLPIYGLWVWANEYYRYGRVKNRTDILAIPI